MASGTIVIEERRLLVSYFWGDVAEDDLLDHYRSEVFGKNIPLDYDELVDFRRVVGAQVALGGLDKVAHLAEAAYRQTGIDARCAIVAEAELIFGLSRMFEMGHAPSMINTRVFKSADDALAWLGLDPEVIPEVEQRIDVLVSHGTGRPQREVDLT